jgi:Type I restriction enzyme R protein N terminus (HSDR_N)
MDDPTFPDFNFDALSEADVREEVISFVLRRLGYRSGTENNILRERAIELRYPNMFLGRKKPEKDPILRGRPDYICDARGVTRWAIEAKPPGSAIGRDDIEQAHSYSVHAELAAPLFVLTNGRDWLVFESNRGPAVEPILHLTHHDIKERFYLLENLLSPNGLRRRYPVCALDLGEPIAKGFGSKAKIIGGFTRYDSIEILTEGLPPGLANPALASAKKLIGYQVAITGASCFRSDGFGIVADLRMHHPHEGMRNFAEQVGLASMRYATPAMFVSQNQAVPTIFEYTNKCTIPAGTRTFDITTWSDVTSPISMELVIYAEAIGHLAGNTFLGAYSSSILAMSKHGNLSMKQSSHLRGSFEVELSTA